MMTVSKSLSGGFVPVGCVMVQQEVYEKVFDRFKAGPFYFSTFAENNLAMAAGIALVPEERRSQGLFTILTIRGNVPVMNMKKISRNGFINDALERNATLEYVDKLKIATNSIEKEAAKLSGGNQQKVVLAKWLATNPKVLILDEPTRGIDVGAKAEVHQLMNDLARAGKCVMMISSELPEILNMSDRILVMREGRLVAELSRHEATQELVMEYATGVRAPTGEMQP
jgi:ABC-type sugar transport system ATPase subunit